MFGSHVAQILRRLRRVCARYGSSPVFILASATASEPGASASRLTGVRVEEVCDDASPRGATSFALWEPPLTELRGEHGAPVRRTATAEAATLLADLVVENVQTLAFVRSRRGAESVSLGAKRALAEISPELPGQVAAYRAGYLPEERRALEKALRTRSLVGLASTNALELGVDVVRPGLRDRLRLARARARRCGSRRAAPGRAGQDALAVLIARDDPLDTYLVHHPSAIFGTPVEATVLDPDNPYVLAPHLCAAASELPLTEKDLELFGPTAARASLPDLVRRGMLRHRPGGLVLDQARTRLRPGRHPRRRRPAHPGRRGRDRPPARHGRRGVGAHDGPRGRGLPAPGRVVRRADPRPLRLGRPGRGRRPRLQHHGARRHRHLDPGDPALGRPGARRRCASAPSR